MIWTITGPLAKLLDLGPMTLTWEAGRFSGDLVAIRAVTMLATERDGLHVGPVCGPYTVTRHLEDAISAAVLIAEAFAFGSPVSGDVPMRDPDPEGGET